jgi:hypothetical protein
MDKLGDVTKNLVSPGLQKRSGVPGLSVKPRSSIRPPVANRETDVVLPNRLWEAWHEAGKSRCLRRALTAEERSMLEARKAELEPWVSGFHESETDEITESIASMYSFFPAMGTRSDAEAVAMVARIMRDLRDFPAWAIIKACDHIRVNGLVRKEGDRYITEPHWPPSGPEIIHEVRQATALYGDTYRSATELLTAEVAR